MKALEKKLSELRSKIANAIDTRNSINDAPLSRLEVEAKIDRFIKDQRSAFISLSKDFLRSGSSPWGIYAKNDSGRANLAPVLCYLFPEDTRARLLDDIDAEGAQYGLAGAERSAKEAELTSQILAWEREEESIVVQLLEAGAVCERRSDIQNPIIIALKANAVFGEAVA